jgi:diguanylate cyclase (GGDEF)-like protein
MAGGQELGYMLVEKSDEVGLTGPAIHLDLMRTFEAVIAAQAIERHAADLERLVDERTAELRDEVDARRHAEAQLLEEVAIRRRWENELQRANEELQRSLMLDGMTQIANRTAFERHLALHWEVLRGTDRPFALMMIDVDFFKRYNDLNGHVAGDEALRRVGEVLQASVRESADLACRYGGEEFAVLLPGTGRAGARSVAHRIQTRLDEIAIVHGDSPVSGIVTISGGIAVCRPALTDGPSELVAQADAALDAAKAQGRNRVFLAAEEPVARASAPVFAG